MACQNPGPLCVADSHQKPVNRCDLVWQGIVKSQACNKFIMQQCPSEEAAKQFLKQRNLVHLWDLARNFIDDET